MEEKISKIDFKESIRNLKMCWRFAKKNRKYLFAYMCFHIILCIIGVFTPMFSAKQLLFLNGSKWDSLIGISIFIFVVEISRNICRFIASKSYQLFFRETLTDLQLELAKETLKLETEEIDNNSSGYLLIDLIEIQVIWLIYLAYLQMQ